MRTIEVPLPTLLPYLGLDSRVKLMGVTAYPLSYYPTHHVTGVAGHHHHESFYTM